METYKPQTQPTTYFYLGISGHIESGEFRELDGLSIKCDFVAGSHWILAKGNESGISQHSFKSQGMNKRIVWNFPFEATYRSLNVQGWPQIVVYLSGKDMFGREVIEGYGTVHVPTQPGRHTRYLRTFTPVASSVLTKILGWATGKNAEYLDAPTLIAGGEGREVTRVKSGGLVKIVFQVTQRNLASMGYATS